ncbi:rRNA maturation RNase YbeY [Patescibacteria group bacterium]|nr:rRNA maturation RNase YbeY [Patescibacteria group bacterium]
MNKKWQELKNEILGENFNLSLVYATNRLIRKLNKIYRKKDKPTTVLSFPLSKKDGEIFLNLALIKKEKINLDYLFIHSLLHLKGFRHGVKMEKKEKSIFKKFYGKKNYNRY